MPPYLTSKSRDSTRPKGLPPPPKLDLLAAPAAKRPSVRVAPVIALGAREATERPAAANVVAERAPQPPRTRTGVQWLSAAPTPVVQAPSNAEDQDNWDALLARSRHAEHASEEHTWQALRERVETSEEREWEERLARVTASSGVHRRVGSHAPAVRLWP